MAVGLSIMAIFMYSIGVISLFFIPLSLWALALALACFAIGFVNDDLDGHKNVLKLDD